MERHESRFVRVRKITGEQLNKTQKQTKKTHKNKFAVQISEDTGRSGPAEARFGTITEKENHAFYLQPVLFISV